MAQAGRNLRIFVSSTFADLKEERNALQERVFPRLRELCMQQGTRFQVIDLRWGVSEEAALDQQTMKICLGEIERCQRTTPRPNFIVLLGDRYGWCPPPPQIPPPSSKRSSSASRTRTASCFANGISETTTPFLLSIACGRGNEGAITRNSRPGRRSRRASTPS